MPIIICCSLRSSYDGATESYLHSTLFTFARHSLARIFPTTCGTLSHCRAIEVTTRQSRVTKLYACLFTLLNFFRKSARARLSFFFVRTDPIRFLGGCCKRRLNQGYFGFAIGLVFGVCCVYLGAVGLL